MSTTIDAVRGMRDVPPREFETQAAVTARIERVLASYGYQPIDLPIVERRDLYLRKLGEELIGKVYEFTFSGRELALRPEWTASVLRSYVGRMQDQPLPLRLRYHGPVFRNERPQRATYRQFTQLGVELIGGPAPRADAECIALACAGLDAAGLDSYQVLLGHIGFIRNVLTELGLAERTQGLLVWSLERMRKEGVDAVRTLLDDDDGELPFDAALLDGLDDARAEALLIHSLKTIGVNLQFGTRPPEAIVGRLVRKLRRGESRASVDQALTLLQQLSTLKGPASQALPQAEALLRDFNLPAHGLDELRAVLELAVAHGVDAERLVIDVGLGRGLHYYTGIIFEIYADDGLQLCGGGRYDDLVTALGGRRQTPAVGFSYGVERVVASLSRPPAQAVPAATALVVAETDSAYPYALEVAQALRERGFITTVDVRGRGVAPNARDAARRAVDFLAVASDELRASGEILWRNLATREEQRVALREIVM
jgi:histidyl-tRNA synthetase